MLRPGGSYINDWASEVKINYKVLIEWKLKSRRNAERSNTPRGVWGIVVIFRLVPNSVLARGEWSASPSALPWGKSCW